MIKVKFIVSIIFPVFLFLVSVFFLSCCKSHEVKGPNVYGGRRIIFDKNYVTVDAGKNKITFKTSKYSEDMEITEVLTIIGNDSTSHLNETYPYDPSSITKSSFKQTFYRYRDTVYGEWYTVIHKKRKLFVELKENNTGKSRKLAVFVGAGNDHGGVYMTQKTKK